MSALVVMTTTMGEACVEIVSSSSSNGQEDGNVSFSATATSLQAATAAGKHDDDDNFGQDKYTFAYTGRHDHGDMPKLRSSSEYDTLVAFMSRAKEAGGQFLSNEAAKAKTASKSKDKEEQPSAKRQKVKN